MWSKVFSTLFILTLIAKIHSACVHDQFVKEAPKHFYNDLADKRLLTQKESGKIRIYADYTQLTVGTQAQINTIKRITNITANYFYNVINVTRLSRLYYPSEAPLKCNNLKVDEKYVSDGVIGDMGVILGNQVNQQGIYIAKSLPCAFQASDNRSTWGIVIWNNAYLKFDQIGFQEMLYVSNHQFFHLLGFSASMYQTYPKGNPLVMGEQGEYYLNSSKIQDVIKQFFGCNNSKGLPLQDQDGTLIASHWERKVVGNQFMIATGKLGAYFSNFSLALLGSTGWYTFVNFSYSQPTTWGQGKGCDFLNIDSCQGQQFCQDTQFKCNWETTAISRCNKDSLLGSCQTPKYFVNTICVDENFETKNLNSKLNALERGGSSSRCFNSDFRQQGLNKSKLNQRCYISVCSTSGQNIYIMVGSFVLICRKPGQVINPPAGLTGSLTCPKNFDNICKNKKTCPYHCNKNGVCVDGKCLCTGSTALTPSCIDVSIFISPVGLTGGLLNSLSDSNGTLTLNGNSIGSNRSNSNNRSGLELKVKQTKQYSLNSKCIQGTVQDKIFGDCIKCKDMFNCQKCNDQGCLICDNGRLPINKRCI